MFYFYPLRQKESFELKRESVVCEEVSAVPRLKQNPKVGCLERPHCAVRPQHESSVQGRTSGALAHH